jgi:hypothetical protein
VAVYGIAVGGLKKGRDGCMKRYENRLAWPETGFPEYIKIYLRNKPSLSLNIRIQPPFKRESLLVDRGYSQPSRMVKEKKKTIIC